MIRTGCETCAVQVRAQRADGVDTVGVRLFAGEDKRRKLLHINGKNAARAGELMGHVTCVMFSPEDIELMRGAPQGRTLTRPGNRSSSASARPTFQSLRAAAH